MASTGTVRMVAAGVVAGAAALYALSRFLKKRGDISGRTAKLVIVLGGQWGDEGKGKLVDILAQDAQVCARFNGGANAGHTLVVDGQKYAFHLLPCGMINKRAKNLIGNGVVVHIPTLMQELEQLKSFDAEALARLFISDRAQVLLDSHRSIDGLLEAEKSSSSTGALGTTKRGIGPCYASKINRNGLRFVDLLDAATLPGKMRDLYKFQERHYQQAVAEIDQEEEIKRCVARAAAPRAPARGAPPHARTGAHLSPRALRLGALSPRARSHLGYAKLLAPQIVDCLSFVHEEMAKGSRVLVEGANAALLDIDFGTFPFVTSSSTTVGGVCTGLGVPPKQMDCVIGVVKAYTTRVGAGPFPTELNDSVGQRLRDVGYEYGTTTGRPRRCGWLDMQVVKYGAAINGYDSINITKLDVLTGAATPARARGHPCCRTGVTRAARRCGVRRVSGLSEINIGVAYKLHGKRLPPTCMPASLEELAAVEVEYITVPGWKEDIAKCQKMCELPAAARQYLKTIEELAGIPVSWVGVGPDREDMLPCA